MFYFLKILINNPADIFSTISINPSIHQSISIKLRTSKNIETETEIEASPEASLAAHQAYNRFMESVTGFTAKQRVDRAKAQAKKDAKIAAEREMQS